MWMKSYLLFIRVYILGFCLLSALFLPAPTFAQFNALPTSVNLELIPENPRANQSVNASLTSYDTDINAATISWSVNGSVVKSGKGIKTFTFTTGKVGTRTTLTATITTSTGEKITKSYVLRPADIDLLWESVGYTPPFYKGKALFAHQNRITFIALPHITNTGGTEISPSRLIYTWSRNGSVVESASGYGKNTYTLIGSLISRSLDVSVTATSPDTGAVASSQTLVTPVEPSILLYEKSPLYGIQLHNALAGTFSLDAVKEMEVLGIPLFFGTSDMENNSIAYSWKINNTAIDADTTRSSRTFRKPDGTSGVSFISLDIEHSSKILQSASSGFNLTFTAQADSESSL